MQGFLQVWHGFFSRWTKYYFRIHEDTLIFGPKREQIEGKIHLGVAQIISIIDDPITFIINTGTQNIRLRANSIDERIKWFKKLKKIQKQITEMNYAKQISSMNQQKSKNNKIKMLQAIVTQLWQSHAQLQNQIQQISLRFKSLSSIKNLTDKLRIIVQSIKLKSSQALKIIQDYALSQNYRKQLPGIKNLFTNQQQFKQFNSDYVDNNGTKFMSFDQNKINGLSHRVSKKQINTAFNSFEYPQLHSPTKRVLNTINTFDNSIVQAYKANSNSNMFSSRHIKINNTIKQNLIDYNPAFIDVKKNLSSNKNRTVLPQKFTPQEKFPLASVLKKSIGIGTDLTKFSLPVTVNQPLSMLQKGCEQMYYSKLLDIANDQETPEKRMVYVVAFLISQYSLTDLRTKKPFNPLLGETFQFYDQQRQFSYISEQVSHHPPISAMYCISDTFQIFDQSKGTTNFTGTSIKVSPEGRSKLRLQKYQNQIYKYNKCTIALNNLVVGKTSIQVLGDLVVECKGSGVIAKITFKQPSFFNKIQLHSIQGEIRMKDKLCYTISGKWNQLIKAADSGDLSAFTPWVRQHVCQEQYYNFNEYTMLLNYLHKQNLSEIAPTDSRLRPDQRALQYQYIDLAINEKLRLQQKQRKKRKQMQRKLINHAIKWFRLEKDDDGDQIFVSNHLYEDQRKRGDWNHFPDIFC